MNSDDIINFYRRNIVETSTVIDKCTSILRCNAWQPVCTYVRMLVRPPREVTWNKQPYLEAPFLFANLCMHADKCSSSINFPLNRQRRRPLISRSNFSTFIVFLCHCSVGTELGSIVYGLHVRVEKGHQAVELHLNR